MKAWLAASFAAIASVAAAQAEGYVQGSAGVTTAPWLDISGIGYRMKTGYDIGASAGLKLVDLLGPSWDIRGDVLYTKNQYACCTAHLGGVSFMADLIYHINLDLPVKPYVGLGLGGVAIQYGNAMVGPHETNIRFGGQALGGIEYPINSRFSAFAEYRYIRANNASFTNLGHVEYQTHNVMIGLKLSL